jgi:N-acetylmuramoyl-L-alanine amidase
MSPHGLRCALVVLALGAMAPAFAATSLRKVELVATSPDSARIVLDLSALPQREVFTVDKGDGKPDRIVIDLAATRLATGVRLPKAAGPVSAIRSGTQPGKALRLVVDLPRRLEPTVSVSGKKLVIDIGEPKVSAATGSAPVLSPVAAPAVPAPVRARHAPEDTGRDIIVAVDAGHGGKDNGATGARGTREKDVTLAIARALAKKIDAEPGLRAYLVRDEDKKIELSERRRRASRANADIFVSVHADAIKNRDVAGSSVYVLSEKGASSEDARLLAEQENAVDGAGSEDVDDQLASVLMDVRQQTSITRSMEVADGVLSRLDRVGTVRKTQVQRAGFAVLKLPIPSLLVETAYISNLGEEKKLADPAHQRDIAEAIFNGLQAYLRSHPPDGTLFARQREAGRGIAPVIAGSAGP